MKDLHHFCMKFPGKQKPSSGFDLCYVGRIMYVIVYVFRVPGQSRLTYNDLRPFAFPAIAYIKCLFES